MVKRGVVSILCEALPIVKFFVCKNASFVIIFKGIVTLET